MDYQVNLDWTQARALAEAGSLIRRINWLDRFIFVESFVWFLKKGSDISVVTAKDFTTAEFLAGDWTTTWPDQLICYNPPPDPDPETPPLWNGCKQIGWGSTAGGTWLLPDGSSVINSKLHLEFGATGTATILAAIVAPIGSSISIGGDMIDAQPFSDTSETFNVNPPREFPGVSSLDFDFQVPEGGLGGSASIRVCFYPGQTGQPDAGGPIIERYQFRDWPSVPSTTTFYGLRTITNPYPGKACTLTIGGGVDDSLWVRVGKTWAKADIIGRNWSTVLQPGASIQLAARNDNAGEVSYDLTGTFTL